MKTKQWIGIIFAFLLILSGCTNNNNRGTVKRPAMIARNTNGLEIDKIVLSDTATVLYIKAFSPPGSSIKPDPNTFLTDNQGKKYTVRSTEGISLEKWFIMPESGETEFTMTFPPIASNAVFIDYSEGDYDGAWNIWGIQLTNRPINVQLPRGFKAATIDKNAVLPPVEFKTGKAHLEGQILNYRQGMPAEVLVEIASVGFSPSSIKLPVDEQGKFSGEIDAFSVHLVNIYWANNQVQCFIAPDETTSLILNPAEITRRSSRFADDHPSWGEPVYYGGYLAAISKELAGIKPTFSPGNLNSYESQMAFLQTIGTKTPEELRDFLLEGYRAKKAELDTLNVSPAMKQILRCNIDLFHANNIVSITSWIDRAYIYNNHLNGEAQEKYLATRKFNFPDDFYNVLKDFSLLNDSLILYVNATGMYVYLWQTQNLQPVFSKALGTDQGILFDLMRVTGVQNDIQSFKPVSEAQIKQLPIVFQEFIRNKNNELLQLIEANKNKTGFTENDIEKVADKDVFPFILSKFRGKPVLIDFWATWCGPCKRANEELKPVKAELANKDIVYVFVAGENSPLEAWKNMIPDLHGEHFRLSEKQWTYVTSAFGIDGVPTYFFIDREGNIKDKLVGYPGVAQMKEKLLKLLDK